MTRLNFFLLLIAVACALSVVTSQHKARRLFMDLQQEEARSRALEVEWGQLQLEQSTWAMHPRIEKIAASKLAMRVPEAARTQIVRPAPAAAAEAAQ